MTRISTIIPPNLAIKYIYRSPNETFDDKLLDASMLQNGTHWCT